MNKKIEEILPLVSKPGRYVNNEPGSYHKESGVRFLVAFPDIYEIGMTSLAVQIIYYIINQSRDALCERVFAPWEDMEKRLRSENIPLFSLESKTPLKEFDCIAFSLQYELNYTNVLSMLELSRIPIYANERKEGDPLICCGGYSVFNPKPILPFFDFFLIGDIEVLVPTLIPIMKGWKEHKLNRDETLDVLSKTEGVYVPGKNNGVRRQYAQSLYSKSVPYPIIPLIAITQDRLTIEIARGCTRGCRFCEAGMTTRPYRERSVGDIISIVERGVRRTGYEKVNLLSLSAGDYSHIEDLVERLSSKNIRISLPSLRGDTLTPKIAKYMEKGGITLAPETGTEKLRRVINKEIDEEKTLYSLRIAKNAGFTHAKLYFMIGLPLEDSQDIQGIIKFVSKVRSIPIKVSISPFVPRPHTPFQWERQASIKELREKIHYLRKNLRGVKFNYRDPIGCFLEGIFSRGDERLAQVIERAYRNGARFDEWSEKFDFSLWQSAFDSQGINPEEYLRQRDINESLPWDNIDMGIKKEYLLKEREKAFSLKYTPDCRIIGCTGCGICDGTNLIPMPKKTTIIHQYGRWPVKKETSGVRIRYRIKFEKGEKLRFIGHLDTARLIIMAIKKSNLPVLYTKGFKPKPRLSFSPPLPLLMTSKSEFIDIWMERIPKGNVLETIQKNLPSGIKLLKSSIISLKEKSLSETAIFERVSVFNVGIEEKQIQEFMKRDIIPVVKRDKEFDIRKSIIDMKKEDNDLIILKKISKVKIFWILENLLKISPEDSLKLKIEREELLKLDGKKLDFS